METQTTTEPRIYVACLASYNAGKLHGAWIDATDEDTINDGIASVLKTSTEPGAEEWAIHDYEGFGKAKIGEYTDTATVARVAALIAEHGEVFAALLSGYCGEDLDHAETLMTEGYRGEWSSLEAYAEDFLDDTGAFENVPDDIRRYFDFEAYARDMECNGEVFTIEIGSAVHVFDATI